MAGQWVNRRRIGWFGGMIALLTVGFGVEAWWRAVHPWRAESPDWWEKAANVPLALCPPLRDLVEPIAPIRGESHAGSDDHWFEVTFRDARGVERTAQFVFYWPSFGKDDPETYRTLIIDKHRVAPSSVEERACLGLLERWWRGNDAAHALQERVQRRDPTLRDPRGIAPTDIGQIEAGRLMFVLWARN